MGSREGYEYHYRFSIVNEDEINSKYKLNHRDEVKAFLFEIRTNFIILRKKAEEEGVDRVLIDSEKYDARVYEDQKEFNLNWMTKDEIDLFVHKAFAFAKQTASDPQHVSLNTIPIVVDLDVCTVQQEGEPFDACMDRTITAQKLVPLYLWPYPTFERRPSTAKLLNFLRELRRVRVENIDEGLALMQVCPICSRNTSIGAQISSLSCGHAFHSHCIVRWLEGDNLCPSCYSPAYDACIAWRLDGAKTSRTSRHRRA